VDLLDALVDRRHDVVLLTNMPDLVVGTRVRARIVDLGPKLGRRSAARLLLETPRLLMRIARALQAERPVGVLFLHFKKEQLLCALLPARLTGRIVWAEWGPLPRQMRSGPGRWLYALAARRASAILAISAGTRATVVAAGVPPEKVSIVPNLVDVDDVAFDEDGRRRLRGDWGAGETTFVIGCMSRLQRRKRNDVVVDAMAWLDGDALLVIAGDGEEEGALRARAVPYGDRVRFIPNVRGHAEAFISACDVMVFAPSPTEGEPRSIVMAQLMGVPVIATDAEGAEGLIPEGGGTIVADSHDPHALAQTLRSYWDDPQRRRDESAVSRAATLASHDPERTLAAVEHAFGVRN
jgi:glycosyltransferase involved in cell wall biosynthesis